MIDKSLIADRVWIAIDNNAKIRNIVAEHGKITFIVSQSFLLRKDENYFVALEKSNDPHNENVICTVRFRDIVFTEKLNYQFFFHKLVNNKHFNVINLYFADVLSFEVDKKKYWDGTF